MSILQVAALILGGLLAGLALGAFRTHRLDRRRSRRVDALTAYLEKASLGQAATLLPSGEDDLSRLQDEIGKTVTALQRTRTQAVQAKEDYARNLSSIAHQIKTPLTAISLAVQSLEAAPAASARHAKTIESQVERLTQLQEDLILMAKLDAGVLQMQPAAEDAFTLMTLAAENVETLAALDPKGLAKMLAVEGLETVGRPLAVALPFIIGAALVLALLGRQPLTALLAGFPYGAIAAYIIAVTLVVLAAYSWGGHRILRCNLSDIL